MIARQRRGWTKPTDADTYENLLKEKVLPGLRNVAGYQGGYILRHNGPDESEFVVINFFDSIEAIKRFAGPDYSTPVFEPEARSNLSLATTKSGSTQQSELVAPGALLHASFHRRSIPASLLFVSS
jgi:hypothetical protein